MTQRATGRGADHVEQAARDLLDRGAELEAMRNALRETLHEAGGTFMVLGAAGVGKTTLLRRFRQDAQDAGFRVLEARGEFLERDFPWGTVRRLFHRAGGERSGAAGLAGIPLDGAEREGGSLFAALHGLYWLTVELAQDQPVALLVDDAHWVDLLSLRWLAYLSARVSAERVLLVVATRQAAMEADEEMWPALLSEAHVLELGALGEVATARLLEDILGRRPGPSFAASCLALTKGNPLLVTELARATVAAGVTGDEDGARWLRSLPPTALTPTVALRLRRLGREAIAVAHAIAVLGPDANPGRIAHLAGLTSGEATRGLQRLADDRLVSAEPEIEFAHPLMRSAAYEDLGAYDRSAWHAAAARLLADEQLDPDTVGGHILLAAPQGELRFVELLRDAAGQALGRAAPEAAARYLVRAIAEPPADRERGDVLLELGYAQLASEPDAAVDSFRAALDASRSPEQGLAANRGLAQALVRVGSFQAATDILEAELQAVGSDQASVRDSLLAELLNAARWDHESRRRTRPYVDELRRRFARGEVITPELHANLAIELLAGGTDREAALAHAEAALANLEVASLQDIMWAPSVMTPLACAGTPRRALQTNRAIIESARAGGAKSVLSVTLAGNAYVKLWVGRVRDAVADADDALGLADDLLSQCFAVIFLAEAHIQSDHADAAWALLEAHGMMGPVPELWPFPWIVSTRGWLRFLRGDVNGALVDLHAAGVLMLRFDFRTPAVLPWRARIAMVWAARGERDRALRLAGRDLRDARRWGESHTIAAALTVAGTFADGDEAVGLLEEALRQASGPDAVVPRIDALIVLGGLVRRQGQRRRARELLGEAQTLAHETGALMSLRRAREELLAAGARPRRATTRGADALTPAEVRVARLAAEGRSNPEIAQQLFITRRTVETHLTSAYSKLGLHGREQLAVALA